MLILKLWMLSMKVIRHLVVETDGTYGSLSLETSPKEDRPSPMDDRESFPFQNLNEPISNGRNREIRDYEKLIAQIQNHNNLKDIEKAAILVMIMKSKTKEYNIKRYLNHFLERIELFSKRFEFYKYFIELTKNDKNLRVSLLVNIFRQAKTSRERKHLMRYVFAKKDIGPTEKKEFLQHIVIDSDNHQDTMILLEIAMKYSQTEDEKEIIVAEATVMFRYFSVEMLKAVTQREGESSSWREKIRRYLEEKADEDDDTSETGYQAGGDQRPYGIQPWIQRRLGLCEGNSKMEDKQETDLLTREYVRTLGFQRETNDSLRRVENKSEKRRA